MLKNKHEGDNFVDDLKKTGRYEAVENLVFERYGDSESLKMLAMEHEIERIEHWKSICDDYSDTYKDELESVINAIKNISGSGRYDVFRGENKHYQLVSSSMFRMTRALMELIEHHPRLISEKHIMNLLRDSSDNQETKSMLIHTMNPNELRMYKHVLPVHREDILQNPDLLMQSLEKHFDLEFQSRSRRIYESDNSDPQSEIQHHLGKTRRIDMSKCIYKALFFACYGSGNHDGRIMFFSDEDLQPYGSIVHPDYTDGTRFKNQESVFFVTNSGYIKPKNENILTIPKNLKIPILLWLKENKGIFNRTIYNDTLGLIENQNVLEDYYKKYNQILCLIPSNKLDDYESIIEDLDDIIDIVPSIIDIERPNYDFLSKGDLPDIKDGKFNLDYDSKGRYYIAAPYYLYFLRAEFRMARFQNQPEKNSDGELDISDIELALNDLFYTRYLIQFHRHCTMFLNDTICLREGLCYIFLGDFEKAERKFLEALEISERFETQNKDEIVEYLSQIEDIKNRGIDISTIGKPVGTE